MTRLKLENQLRKLIADKYGSEHDLSQLSVSVPAETKFGDYATNAAMVLAKQLGRVPRELAGELSRDLQAEVPAIERVEVAGPGFINLTMRASAVVDAAKAAVEFKPADYNRQKIVLEYSDPNPFKPLHAGHLYTTLVGDAIGRLLELGGGEVVRISYGGDVGLHVAKTMWGIIGELGGEYSSKLGEIPTAERSRWLGACYVKGNNAYDDSIEAKAEITVLNKRIYELHATNDQDSEFAKIYWTGREWSYEYFPQLYFQLQVHPFDRTIPESEVAPLGQKIVNEQVKTGVYQESNGAIVFRGEDYGLHTRVFINSQGLPTYEAKDVGLLLTKWNDYHFDRSIVITANEQEQYMAVMLKSVEQFAPEPAKRSEHLTHGFVKLAGGVKMSSRKGNIVGAIEILAAAKEAALAISPDSAGTTMLAAVKYAFMKQRIGADIIYDPDESVSLEGNSGPYLQYAHARARSIISKSSHGDVVQLDDIDGSERVLASKLAEYADVVQRSVTELMPHHIGGYLYELAQTFNRFYEGSRVIGDKREAQRLALVRLYAEVLASGLGVLGIEAPERL